MWQYIAAGGALISAGMSYKAGYTARQQAKLNAKREEYRGRVEAEQRKLRAQQQHADRFQVYIEDDATNIALVGITGRDINDRSIQAMRDRQEKVVATDLSRIDTQADMEIDAVFTQSQLTQSRFRQQGSAAYKQGMASAISSLTGAARDMG
tara:strand:- start:722 stop:1177 length:456 start_codon:yes stop_codon:yes gene_type:complete